MFVIIGCYKSGFTIKDRENQEDGCSASENRAIEILMSGGSSSLSVAVNPTQEAAGPGGVLAPLGHTSFV